MCVVSLVGCLYVYVSVVGAVFVGLYCVGVVFGSVSIVIRRFGSMVVSVGKLVGVWSSDGLFAYVCVCALRFCVGVHVVVDVFLGMFGVVCFRLDVLLCLIVSDIFGVSLRFCMLLDCCLCLVDVTALGVGVCVVGAMSFGMVYVCMAGV